MKGVPPIRLTEHEFAALAAGGGDAAVVDRLRLANRSRTLLAIGFVATRAAGTAVARAYRVLADARAVSPEAVWRVLDEPEVALWAIGAARELVHGGDRCPPGLLANVAAAAAVRAGVPADLTTTAAPCVLPSLGTVAGSGREVRVRPDGDGCLVDAGGPPVRVPPDATVPAPGWTPLRTARLGPGVVTLDEWRLTAPPAFGGVLHRSPDAAAWSRVLSGAVGVLDRHGRAGATVAAVRTVSPLRGTGPGPSSATLSDAFGCVLLSLPDNARAAAVALAHEVQHAKLAVLHDLFPLLETGAAERFYAPWRQDPRPLLGLLHGSYAYVGVVDFWRRQRLLDTDPAEVHEAEVEFARWLAATREAVDVLAGRPELTGHGRRFVAAMATTLAEWSAEPVSRAARAEAERQRLAHRDRFDRAS